MGLRAELAVGRGSKSVPRSSLEAPRSRQMSSGQFTEPFRGATLNNAVKNPEVEYKPVCALKEVALNLLRG